MGEVYELQGRYKEAIENLKEAFKRAGRSDYAQASLAPAYAMDGQKKQAQTLLADMLELHKISYFSPTNIASVYVALGDQNSALNWLKIALEERDPWLLRLEVDQHFDPLRNMPEFKAIMQKATTPD